MKLKKEHFLFGLALLTLGVTSCKKDDVVFNQTSYNDLVKASFPVKDVDRNQNWAAMESAQVNVKTYGRFANGCAIKIYAENPIVVDKPTLLAQTAAMSGVDTRTFSTSISYMVGQGMIYVTVIDAQGYMTVVPKSVSPNETVSVEIGEPATVASRHRVLTVADQIPTIAYSTMQELGETVKDGAEELTQAYADNVGNIAPLHLKISGTWNYTCSCLGDERGRTLYIAKNATWNIPAGAKVHVGRNGVIFLDEGAKINLGSGAKLISDMKGQIVCMKNSEINDTNDNGEVNIANGTAGDKIIYNAGTIKVGTFDNNGGYFYNANKVITNFYQSSSFNGQNVNRGSIQVNGNANMVNSALFNACKFVCTGELTVAYIVNGNGAYIACGSYLPDGSYNNVWSRYLYLGGNSLMDVKGEFNNQVGVTISGPTTGSDYGIFQCVSIPKNTNMPIKFLNNVYVCRKELYVDKVARQHYHDGIWDDNYYTTENQVELAWEASFNKNNEGNGHAVMAAYQQVNIVKDADECSPQYVPDTPKEVEDQPMTLRFLFEDNFPDLGDFDFNDCVFTVTPSVDANNAKKVTVAVRLEATGASKTNGAAIRLVGITDAMLTSKNVTNALPVPDSHLGNYHIPDGDFTISQDPSDNTSLVLLICKDVHYALNSQLGSDGTVQRLFYNTCGDEGWKNYGSATPKTVTYTFEFKNETDAQKMLDQATYDAFIVEEYNGGTWEVHTVQNDRKGALVLPGNEFQFHRNNYQNYLTAYINDAETGNYPWAVMVPGTVAYPLEGRNMTVAYPNFASWAQNHTVNTDWYNSPSSGDVHAIP